MRLCNKYAFNCAEPIINHRLFRVIHSISRDSSNERAHDFREMRLYVISDSPHDDDDLPAHEDLRTTVIARSVLTRKKKKKNSPRRARVAVFILSIVQARAARREIVQCVQVHAFDFSPGSGYESSSCLIAWLYAPSLPMSLQLCAMSTIRCFCRRVRFSQSASRSKHTLNG